jgi:large subunit ribosomal protein L18
MSKVDTKQARLHRHVRVRAKLEGTDVRPRLAVYRSSSHIYAQIIDDGQGVTIVAASTLEPEVIKQTDGKPKTEQAKIVGSVLAQKAVGKGIKEVVFDRGGFRYHGRVKALAEGAREAGLKF